MEANAEEDVEMMSLPITTEQIFLEALGDFKAILTERQRELFPGKTSRDVKLKVLGIQKHQERLKALMNFARIRFYLERFEEFDDVCRVANIGGDDLDEISSFIWGPSDYILQVSREVPSVLNVVLDAYHQFGQRVPRLQDYKSLISERPDMTKCIAFMYQDLLEFYEKLIGLLTGQDWKKTFHVNWRDYEGSFKTLLWSFDNHGNVLKKLLEVCRNDSTGGTPPELRNGEIVSQLSQGAAAAVANGRHIRDLIMSQNTRDANFDDMSRMMSRVADDIQRLMISYEEERVNAFRRAREQEKERKKEQKKEVLDWLKAGVEQETYHRNFREVASEVPGTDEEPPTAVWILKENKIMNWIHEEIPDHAIMWLNGKKGAGKTILASTIIQECIEKRGNDFKTSYFYCRGEDNSGLNTAVAILKEILSQLLHHNQDPLPSCVEKKVNSGEQVLTNIDTVRALLELFCNRDMNQFIVIDGLDECKLPEVKPVVKFWQAMVKKCEDYKPGKIRVLLVSQDHGDIRKLMQDAYIYPIPLEKSNADIERYVNHKFKGLKNQFERQQDPFEGLQEQFRLGDEETYEAKMHVCRRAEGMFLYAKLTIENLFKQPNVKALKVELNTRNIPSGIGDAYKKIIERLQRDSVPAQWHMAKTIFALLAGAGRPLKRHELQAALSVEIKGNGETTMNYHDNRLCNDIRETCGTLVQVVQKDRFEFIHSTTRQYILESPHLEYRTIQCDLTVLCLSYLTLDCFVPDLNDEDIKHRIRDGSYAFQDYAIAEWGRHLDKFIKNTSTLFQDSPQHEDKVFNAFSRFLQFHRSSIIAAAEEKPPPGKRSHQRQAVAASQSSSSSQSSLLSQSSSSGSSQSQPPPPISPAEFCSKFVGRRFYPELVELWTHICKHEKRDFKERPKVSLPHLAKLLDSVRGLIAELVSNANREADPANKDRLIEFYGEKHHKCQRVRCDFFYEGFSTKSKAESHANKHDRPFPCPVEGCSMVPFGFQTNKDKDRHVRNYHPEESDLPARFNHGQPEGRQSAEAKWECEICHKKFTRQSIRKDHMDAHYGERKHACETCGKRFTRSNDRNRHRKTHVRRLRG